MPCSLSGRVSLACRTISTNQDLYLANGEPSRQLRLRAAPACCYPPIAVRHPHYARLATILSVLYNFPRRRWLARIKSTQSHPN